VASGTVLGRRRGALAAAGAVVAAVGVLIVLRACDVTEARVLEVQILEGGRALVVAVETCNAQLSVDVDESPERIEIRVSRDDLDLFGSDDCLDAVRVQLDEPVGTRTILTRGGREVPIATVPATEVVTDVPDAAP
jgi:hypothetical protein